MLDKIRILPVLIVSASLLFGLKIEDIWRNAGNLDFTPAVAKTETDASETAAENSQKSAENPKTEQMAARQPESTGTTTTTPAAKPIDINNLTPSELQLLQ